MRCANDAALRQAYAALKDQLAERHRTDRNAYTDAKSDFVRSVVQSGRRGSGLTAGALPPTR